MSRKEKPNPGALPVRLGAFVELYGLEAVATALAAHCDTEAALNRGRRRELTFREIAATLRELAADAREGLDEGLAAAEERIVGRKARFAPEAAGAIVGGDEAAYAIIRAVRKGGIRRAHAPRLTTNRALRAAGGLTRYDLLEIDVYAADGSPVGRDSVPPAALERYASYR
jgi:hypothetical protein